MPVERRTYACGCADAWFGMVICRTRACVRDREMFDRWINEGRDPFRTTAAELERMLAGGAGPVRLA